MKNKIFIIAAAVLLFGITIAAYAFTSTLTADTVLASVSCCKGDACPMKKKGVKSDDSALHCDECTCCKDGLCSMKKGETANAGNGDCCKIKKAHSEDYSMKASGHEFCPMMKEKAHKMVTGPDAKAEHSCGCPCCKSKEKNVETSL